MFNYSTLKNYIEKGILLKNLTKKAGSTVLSVHFLLIIFCV